ncbi:hypothetical protein ACH429_20040 [Streptomyces pathocidini]|uniref:Uncharacterized protein n=1 Tax=Streptomyces pathocidini TaxID=1650571 RepID=A0ABW7UUU3_9ACTN|nr:hypothetical protein [Streptomyces pathocidini]
MGITIDLVVHTSRRQVFEEAAGALAGVALRWTTYEYEHEIRARVAESLSRHCPDGLMLGAVPYDACRDLLPDGLPVTVTAGSGLDLALAFSRAQARGWAPTPVSIDTFAPEVVAEVAEALRLDRSGIGCLPYARERDAAAITEFHRRFLERTGGGYVISARTEVVRRLAGTLPVLNGAPVPSGVRAELHALALRIRSERADGGRFAAGVFRVARGEGALPVSDLEVDRRRAALMNLLLSTPEFADAWIENRGRRGVVVFAHKALFERLTRGWLSVPALGRAEESLGLTAAAGFGIGGSARTSVLLAERAAARAESEGAPCAYLFEDGGVVIGPMGPGSAAPAEGFDQGAAEEDGERIEELARSVGLSPTTLSRLAAMERVLEGKAFSPSDLASTLGITDPSGRRLVRKLSTHGLVTAEGIARTHRKGRPTRLYRLGIDSAMERIEPGRGSLVNA